MIDYHSIVMPSQADSLQFSTPSFPTVGAIISFWPLISRVYLSPPVDLALGLSICIKHRSTIWSDICSFLLAGYLGIRQLCHHWTIDSTTIVAYCVHGYLLALLPVQSNSHDVVLMTVGWKLVTASLASLLCPCMDRPRGAIDSFVQY